MIAEQRRLAFFVGVVGRLIFVLGDFFQNDILFRVEIVLPQRGAHHIGEQVEHGLLVFGQGHRVVDGLLFPRVGVAVGAQLIELVKKIRDGEEVEPEQYVKIDWVDADNIRDFYPDC